MSCARSSRRRRGDGSSTATGASSSTTRWSTSSRSTRPCSRTLDAEEQRDLFHRLAVAISRSGRLTKVGVDRPRGQQSASSGRSTSCRWPSTSIPSLLVFLGRAARRLPRRRCRVADRAQLSVRQPRRPPPRLRGAGHARGTPGGQRSDRSGRPTEAKTYQLSDEIGKTGVERVFEDVLRGVPGVRYLEVDNRGEVIGERIEFRRAPRPGADLYLTIDIDLQARRRDRSSSEGSRRAAARGPTRATRRSSPRREPPSPWIPATAVCSRWRATRPTTRRSSSTASHSPSSSC